MYLSEMIINLEEIKDRFGDREVLIMVDDHQVSSVQDFQDISGPENIRYIAIRPEV